MKEGIYRVIVIPDMTEEWKPIFAYGLNGLYEASTMGRVRSVYHEEVRGGRWGVKRKL